MRDDGALPGIVPTGGWGFGGWAGPAWDIVLVNLPYYLIQYRGDLEAAKIAAPAIMRYLNYLWTRRDENGLLAIGLGDWCPSGHINISHPAPLHFTDTVVSMDIANKAAVIFEKLGLMPQKAFAETIALELRKSAREYLIDKNTLTAVGNCQTTQAMALFYNLFDNGEKAEAYKVLKEFIAVKDDHMFAGILGARVLFRVLSDFGDADLAYKMITRPDGPSYGNWIERGATSLWEDFRPAFSNEERHEISKNHHFFGDISAWFISYICGIRINAALKGTDHVDIMPCFISSLQNAGGEHTLPSGKVSVEWERKDDKTITMKIEVPEGTKGFIRLPKDYRFEDTRAFIPLKSGEYTVTHQSVLSRLEYTF